MEATNYKIDLVCLVDDDSIYTFSVKKILEESPIFKNHIIFNDARTALKHFKSVANVAEKIPDVLFLDINMPVMNGWEFLEGFAKLKPSLSKNVTIYIVSSSPNPADIEKAKLMSDVAQYIIKPINIAQFEKIFKFFDIEAA